MPEPLGLMLIASSSSGGAHSGLIELVIRMYAKYSPDSTRPGITAPRNRLPTDTAIRLAISTSMIDGGIRMPSVADAASVPVASGVW